MRELHDMLGDGSAGPPECWIAHLARGTVAHEPGVEGGGYHNGAWETTSRTTCWMLVITTARHAVWVDYLLQEW